LTICLESQTRVQMPRQWDQRAHANAGHRKPLCVRCDGGLAKISRRHPDRASSPVRKRHYDIGGTSSRALRQHRKLAAKQGMSRVSNRDMGHHPIENCGALQCAVIRPSPTLSSTASCITPIVLRSMGHRCAIPRRPSRIPRRRGRARRIRWSRNRRQERKNEQRALRLAHARRSV
jgi:hypothetical protein